MTTRQATATTFACLLFWAFAACCGALVLFAPAPAFAQSRQPRPAGNYGQPAIPDQEQGRAILNDFRQRGIGGDYYFEFQLRMLPRRGDAVVIPGRMWGSRNERGPITRVTLWPGSPADERRLLVQSGPASALWEWKRDGANPAGAAVTRMTDAAIFEPLAGTEMTPFELQMPFIYWSDFKYEGLQPSRGRPAYTFLMRPPAAIAAARPGLTGVRMYIDTQFYAMLKFEVLGANDRVAKTMTVGETQNVGGQWILRTAELINAATRDKADLKILLAGVKLDLPREIFAPAALATSVEPPPLDTLWQAR